MRILDHDEGGHWLLDWGPDFSSGSEVPKERLPHKRTFRFLPDSGRKTELARLVVNSIRESKGEGVLLIADLAVWPACENLDLFNAYRSTLGETRRLFEAPFHEFGTGDYAALECLLDLVLFFVWNATLIDAVNGTVFHIGHDEWVTVQAATPEPVDIWSAAFTDFGLNDIS